MQSESFWPDDLFKEKLVAPVQILKEQARHLSTASGRSILGKVVTSRVSQGGYGGYDRHEDDDTADVAHVFQLEVPGLGDYTFDLLQIRHQPRSLYPVFIDFYLDKERRDVECSNEDEFRNVMKNIFSSQETVSVVRTLRAQTEDPEALPPKVAKHERAPAPDEPSDDDDIPF